MRVNSWKITFFFDWNLQFFHKIEGLKNEERRTLSLEVVRLHQGWVPNAWPQWWWPTITVHLAQVYVCHVCHNVCCVCGEDQHRVGDGENKSFCGSVHGPGYFWHPCWWERGAQPSKERVWGAVPRFFLNDFCRCLENISLFSKT